MRESELGESGTVVMRVAALTVDPLTTLPVVVLRDERDIHAVTISVGMTEAAAIAAEIDHIELERPMTHQLMADILAKAGVLVDRIVVEPVAAGDACGDYSATIHLMLPSGATETQDARPSDAFALALRLGADICMSRTTLLRLGEQVQLGDSERMHDMQEPAERPGSHVMPLPPAPCVTALRAEESTELLEGLADESFGKWKI